MEEQRRTAIELYSELRMGEVFAAFEKLLASTAYPAVTVTAICAEAGISRPTFYHCFKDKDDIVQWFWNQAGDAYLGQTGKTLGWYEGNLRMLQDFLRHKQFMTLVLGGLCASATRQNGQRHSGQAESDARFVGAFLFPFNRLRSL